MLRPDQVARTNEDTADDLRERSEIEAHFDAALKRAERQKRWPAIVTVTTANWQKQNVDLVMRQFRTAFWIVTSSESAHLHCTIDHPPEST